MCSHIRFNSQASSTKLRYHKPNHNNQTTLSCLNRNKPKCTESGQLRSQFQLFPALQLPSTTWPLGNKESTRPAGIYWRLVCNTLCRTEHASTTNLEFSTLMSRGILRQRHLKWIMPRWDYYALLLCHYICDKLCHFELWIFPLENVVLFHMSQVWPLSDNQFTMKENIVATVLFCHLMTDKTLNWKVRW